MPGFLPVFETKFCALKKENGCRKSKKYPEFRGKHQAALRSFFLLLQKAAEALLIKCQPAARLFCFRMAKGGKTLRKAGGFLRSETLRWNGCLNHFGGAEEFVLTL
ncbi:MAG: hypothetical protein BHW25_00060 [Faecalibacterium sp. CAG:82-related_59_9]|nr:MAG: hypothetical protein BHW25_00060 [Faecalibacterium sp. CAG:82-related_59_9]